MPRAGMLVDTPGRVTRPSKRLRECRNSSALGFLASLAGEKPPRARNRGIGSGQVRPQASSPATRYEWSVGGARNQAHTRPRVGQVTARPGFPSCNRVSNTYLEGQHGGLTHHLCSGTLERSPAGCTPRRGALAPPGACPSRELCWAVVPSYVLLAVRQLAVHCPSLQ